MDKEIDKKLTAYHEAGHIVIAYALRVKIEYGTINSNKKSFGHVRFLRDIKELNPNRKLYKSFVNLSGYYSTKKYLIETNNYNKKNEKTCFNGSIGDLLLLETEIDSDELNHVHKTTETLINRFWPLIQNIATVLCEKKIVFFNDIDEILKDYFTEKTEEDISLIVE